MGLFSKKKQAGAVTEATAEKVDRLTQMARDKLLKMADDAISKAYKDRRLVLSEDAVFYTDQAGKTFNYTGNNCVDDFSLYMYNRLNDQLGSRQGFGVTPNMVMVGVTVEDIRNIVLRLKNGGK